MLLFEIAVLQVLTCVWHWMLRWLAPPCDETIWKFAMCCWGMQL
jgi:hypothetical protein